MIALAFVLAGAPVALAPLAPLAGHCWRGVLPDGNIDTHCFVRGKRGRAVLDRHVVRRAGRAVYRGETRYVAVHAGVRWAYRNAAGPVMGGTMQATATGLRFTVEGGPVLEWRWQGRRAYVAPTGPAGVPVAFVRVR